MRNVINSAVRREISVDFHPYTEITISAPDEADAGDTVNIIVGIKNITDINHIIWTQVYAPSGYLVIDDYVSLIGPGETLELAGSFPMPNANTRITVITRYTDIYMDWHIDATETKDVTLIAEAPICQPGETMCGGPFDRDLYTCSADGMRWMLTERNSSVCYAPPTPPEEKKFPWMWAAIGALVVTTVGVMVLGKKKS